MLRMLRRDRGDRDVCNAQLESARARRGLHQTLVQGQDLDHEARLAASSSPPSTITLQGPFRPSDRCTRTWHDASQDAARTDATARLRIEASSGTSRSYALFSTFRGAQY